MMTEKELISKIRLLRQIEPRKDWVVFSKRRILGEDPSFLGSILDTFKLFPNLFQYKLALVSLVVILILIGTFGFAYNSLPGDLLFPIKKIAERSRAVFVSETEQPKIELELANKRLEELTLIVETNQIKRLAPAINEFQACASEAAQKLVRIKDPEIAREAGKIMVTELKKLEENKEKAESLGVVIGDSEEIEIESAMCKLIEREIKNLGTLTEGQIQLLKEAEEFLKQGKCSLAFEKILFLSYPQK